MPIERLQKILARAGYGSRRSCEQYIVEGRVTIDGKVVSELGAKADPGKQEVKLDGERIRQPKLVYYLLNKPVGILCTNHDPDGRIRAVDLLPDKYRLFTVGRLDEDTEGLLLLTNDGKWSNRLTHPRYGVDKTYQVKIQGKPNPEAIVKLREGVRLSDGKTAPAKVGVKRRGGKISTLNITVSQGMNRQVRRMVARVGMKLLSIRRIAIGRLKLGTLKPGRYRRLTEKEVKSLWDAASDKNEKAGKGGARSEKRGGYRKNKSGGVPQKHVGGRGERVGGDSIKKPASRGAAGRKKKPAHKGRSGKSTGARSRRGRKVRK